MKHLTQRVDQFSARQDTAEHAAWVDMLQELENAGGGSATQINRHGEFQRVHMTVTDDGWSTRFEFGKEATANDQS